MSRFLKIGADGAQLSADATDQVAVLDTKLNLMWSADYVGERHTFAKAQEACAALELAGFNDWRAPTVEELFLLADRTKYDPAIDTDAFPSAKNDWCWTSTVDASSPSGYAWGVNFSSATPSTTASTTARACGRVVRCRRPVSNRFLGNPFLTPCRRTPARN